MDDKWNKEEEIEQAAPLDTKLVVMIILGMAVLAAIICVGLWYFTHMGGQDEGRGELLAQATEEPSAGQNSGQGVDSSSAVVPEITSEPTPVPTVSPNPEQPVGNGSGQGMGASGGENVGSDKETVSGQPSESAPEPGSEAVISPEVQVPDDKETTMGTVTMAFMTTKESVMPKDVVNLRSTPTTTDEGNIVTQIQNGEVIVRTGINEDTGWSMVEYKDEKLYAVSQYLTTDLNYQPPLPPSDPNRVSTAGGRIIVFTNCDDWISPKEYVNLRTEPSTSEGDNTVSCQLYNGQKVHRTGYSADSGWSRVDYGGQVLYVVTSFMVETEAAE